MKLHNAGLQDLKLIDVELGLRQAGCRRVGSRWSCPACKRGADAKDRRGPVSLYAGPDGRRRWKCHQCDECGDAVDAVVVAYDCTVREALERLGSPSSLPMEAPPPDERDGLPSVRTVLDDLPRSWGPRRGLTVADLEHVGARWLPDDDRGYREISKGAVRHRRIAFPRFDASGEVVTYAFREATLTSSAGIKSLAARGGAVPSLFACRTAQDWLTGQVQPDEVWCCEGEIDAASLAKLAPEGVAVVGGSTGSWRSLGAAMERHGRPTVVRSFLDPDDGGLKHLEELVGAVGCVEHWGSEGADDINARLQSETLPACLPEGGGEFERWSPADFDLEPPAPPSSPPPPGGGRDDAPDEPSGPLSIGEDYGPPFPLEVLGTEWGAWVGQLAREFGVAPAMPAMFVLGMLATMCQRRVRVQARRGWVEELGIWVGVVLPAAEMKSPTLRAVLEPLREIERQEAEAAAADFARALALRKAIDDQLTQAYKRLARLHGQGDTVGAEEVQAEIERLEDSRPEAVPPPRYFVTADVTPEALASELHQHKALTMATDEGESLAVGKRYAGGGPPALMLRAANGEDHTVIRKTSTDLHLERPLLSVIAALQPVRLREVDAEAVSCGLPARYCWAIPEPLAHTRVVDTPVRSEDVQGRYEAAVRRVHESLSAVDSDAPVTLELRTDARDVFVAFANAVGPRLAEDGDLAGLREWAGKLSAKVLRLAALLHLSSVAGLGAATATSPPPISADAMRRAVQLGEWLVTHAIIVHDKLPTAPEHQTRVAPAVDETLKLPARNVMRWAVKRPNAEFKRSELDAARHKTKGLDSAERRDAVLALLVERGYLLVRQPPPGDKRRKPRYVATAAAIEEFGGKRGR